MLLLGSFRKHLVIQLLRSSSCWTIQKKTTKNQANQKVAKTRHGDPNAFARFFPEAPSDTIVIKDLPNPRNKQRKYKNMAV